MGHPIRLAQVLGLLGVLVAVMLLTDGVFAVLSKKGVGLAASTVLLIQLVIGWTLVLFLAKRLANSEQRETFLIVPVRVIPAVAGLSTGLGLSLAILSLITWIPVPPPESAMQLSEQLRATNQFSLAIAMLLVGPVAEEMFFRGLVFRAWHQRYGFAIALVGSASLFAILHLLSWQVLVALPLGLLLGWIVLKTGSVMPAILGHFGANIAPRLMDPILAIAGYSDSQIEAMVRAPIWITCLGFILLVAGIAVTSNYNRSR